MDADLMLYHVIAEITAGDGAGKAYEYWIHASPHEGGPIYQAQRRIAEQGLMKAGQSWAYYEQPVAAYRGTWMLPQGELKTLDTFKREAEEAQRDWSARRAGDQAAEEGK